MKISIDRITNVHVLFTDESFDELFTDVQTVLYVVQVVYDLREETVSVSGRSGAQSSVASTRQ